MFRTPGLTLAAAFALAACADNHAPAGPAALSETSAYDGSGAGGEMLSASSAQDADAGTIQLNVVAGDANPAAPSDLECVGPVTGVFANIVVPPGQRCIVSNSIVHGNIKALEDAVLGVFSSQVGGNIIGDKADALQLRNNTIEGNIEISEVGPHATLLEVGLCGNYLPNGNIKVIKTRGGIGISPFAFCVPAAPNIIERGDMQIEDNILDVPGKRLFVSQNTIGQNLQVYKNRGPFGKVITQNTVGQVVQCFDNDPLVFGGPNFAPKREGQCF